MSMHTVSSPSQNGLTRIYSFGFCSALQGFPGGLESKESVCNAGTRVRSLGQEDPLNGYPLQYSCLENSTDRGALRVIVHGVTKSQT